MSRILGYNCAGGGGGIEPGPGDIRDIGGWCVLKSKGRDVVHGTFFSLSVFVFLFVYNIHI